MSDSPFIIDVTAENFDAVVIEGSKTQPVLVDFWAPWCNPCQMLIPVVSKLAEEMNGQFILAKINTDEQQQLAAQNGIKSLPTVKMFKDGQPVDEFMGALPESKVKAFIEQHLGESTQNENPIYEEAMQLYRNGDTDSALSLLNQALAETPDDEKLKINIVNILNDIGDFEGSIAILNSLSDEQKKNLRANELIAQIKMKQRLNDAPSIEELEERIKNNELDFEAYIQLSDVLAAQSEVERALELLFFVLRKDSTFNDEAAKKGLINLFLLLGDDHPLTKSYRRKMFSLMH